MDHVKPGLLRSGGLSLSGQPDQCGPYVGLSLSEGSDKSCFYIWSVTYLHPSTTFTHGHEVHFIDLFQNQWNVGGNKKDQHISIHMNTPQTSTGLRPHFNTLGWYNLWHWHGAVVYMAPQNHCQAAIQQSYFFPPSIIQVLGKQFTINKNHVRQH